MLKKISIYLLSLILVFTLLPNNIVKAESYTQLKANAKIKSGFNFKSGINRDVNFANVGVFVDTNEKVNNAKRGIKENETVTVKIPNGFKYMDGSTYDIYVDVSSTKALSDNSVWVCKTVVNGDADCLTLSPFSNGYWGNDPYVTFDYKIYILDSNGNDVIANNDIDLTAGSCWTAVNEGARPWGNDGTIYTNIPANKLAYETTVKAKNGKTYDVNCWHITDGSYNQLRYYILGHGTSLEKVNYQNKTVTCIKGGYIRNSESGSAEMMFGYFLSASGNDYVGYYDGLYHSITVDTDSSDATITYSLTKDGTYTTDNPTFKDVELDNNGKPVTHTVYYKISGKGYESDKVYSHTVTIKPIPVSITPTADDKTYDGTTTAKTHDVTNYPVQIRSGVSESIKVTGTAGAFENADVGYKKNVILSSYKVEMVNSNNKLTNYKVTVNNPKASIMMGNIYGVSAQSYTGIYDGENHNISVYYNGTLITSDNISTVNTAFESITYYSDRTYSTETNGYKDVLLNSDGSIGSYTVYYRIKTNSNYEDIVGYSTVTIKQKTVYVTPYALDRVWSNDNDTSVTLTPSESNTNAISSSNPITVSTGVKSEQLNIYGLNGSFSDGTVGVDKTVTVSKDSDYTLSKVSDENLDNYNVVINNTTATIYGTDDWYVSAKSYVGVYDGTAHSITPVAKKATTTIEGTVHFYSDEARTQEISSSNNTYSVTNVTRDNSGNVTYQTIYYTFTPTNNTDYTGSKNGSFVVMVIPYDIEVNPKADNKYYDGTKTATILSEIDSNSVSNTYTLTGVNNETATITNLKGEFDNPNAGDGKTVTITNKSDVIASLSSTTNFKSTNYNITINDTTAKIIPQDMTSTATPYDGIYNGDVQGIAVKVSNYSGEDITNDPDTKITYYTDSNLTNIDYMIKDVTLDDDGSVVTRDVYYKVEKENFKTITGSSTVTIRPKEVEVKTVAEDKKYDGNTNATLDELSSIKTGVGNEAIKVTGLTGEFITADVGNNKLVLVSNKDAVVTGVGDTLMQNYYLKIDNTTASIYNSSNTKHFTCEGEHNSLNWVWSDKTGTCVYRVNNTSSK